LASFSKQQAYSLVEILIVITIVALLIVGGVVAYFQQYQLQVYKGAVRQIDSLLRSARSSALSGKIADTQLEDSERLPFGIYFSKGSGVIGALDQGSVLSFYDSYPKDAPNSNYDQEDQLKQEFHLPSKVTITNLQLKKGSEWQQVPKGAVIFQPPRAQVVISDNAGSTDWLALQVEISLEPGSGQKTNFIIDVRTGNIQLQ